MVNITLAYFSHKCKFKLQSAHRIYKKDKIQQVYLVSLDDEHIDSLMASSPYYAKNVISADTYGLPEDVTTVAVGALVLARNDVADADVYNFVSSIFDNLDEVTAAHAKGAELNPEFAFSVEGIPYHPGASRYFTAQG